MKGSFGVARGGLAALALLASLAGVCGAEETSQEELARKGRAELGRAAASLAPHPSMDTTLIEFSILSTTYRVPRNYLTTMDNWQGGPQGMVTFTLTFPDLKPLSPETAPCLLPGQAHPQGCKPLEVRLRVAKGPPSAEQAFQNTKSLYANKTPEPGPDGMELWAIGHAYPRREDFRVDDDSRVGLFSCTVDDGTPDTHGVCYPVSDEILPDQDIFFFFWPRDLAVIRRVDTELRAVITSFVVQSKEQ